MKTHPRRIVRSLSNGRLLAVATQWIPLFPEIIVVAPSHLAGEGISHRLKGVAGLHRTTILQFATDLARPQMARLRLAPLTSLGMEALSARTIHAERDVKELGYFKPVAALPG